MNRVTFLGAEACLLAGSARNAYHTKYRGVFGGAHLSCATLRKGVFAAGAALTLLSMVGSIFYYWTHARADTGGWEKHQNEGLVMTSSNYMDNQPQLKRNEFEKNWSLFYVIMVIHSMSRSNSIRSYWAMMYLYNILTYNSHEEEVKFWSIMIIYNFKFLPAFLLCFFFFWEIVMMNRKTETCPLDIWVNKSVMNLQVNFYFLAFLKEIPDCSRFPKVPVDMMFLLWKKK